MTINNKTAAKALPKEKSAIRAGVTYYPAVVVEDWIKNAIQEKVIEINITELGKRGDVGYIGVGKPEILSGIQWGMEKTHVDVQVLDYAKKGADYEIKHIPFGYVLKTEEAKS